MEETIQHLFFDCQIARIMWRIVQVSFNIAPPVNIAHMFVGWLNGINKKLTYNPGWGICFILSNLVK
jgi:hypothetical protein